MSYLLRDVQGEHKQKLRVYVQRSAFDYSKGVPTGTIRNVVDSNDTEIGALLVNNGVKKRLKPAAQVALVDGRHRSGAVSQMASGDEHYKCQSEGL